MAAGVDQQLAEFLDATRSEREQGYTFANLFRALKTVTDGLAAHEIECLEYRRNTDMRISALELAARLVALPPPRAQEVSTIDVEGFAHKVASAALEGAQRADSTPEDAVRPIVAAEMARREEQRELARLRQAEMDRIASSNANRKTAADKEEKRLESRRSTIRNYIATVVGGGSLAGLIELSRWASTLHH